MGPCVGPAALQPNIVLFSPCWSLRPLFAEVDLDAANRWPGVHWAGGGGLCAVMNKLSFGQNHAVNLALLKGFRHSFFNTFCQWLGGTVCYSSEPRYSPWVTPEIEIGRRTTASGSILAEVRQYPWCTPTPWLDLPTM